MTHHPPPTDRRRFLRHGAHWATATTAVASLGGLAAPVQAAIAPPAGAPGPRELALAHTHTRENIELVYALDNRYLPDALGSLNHFLRDHYTGDVGKIDPRLFDLLHRVRQVLGSSAEYEVISGYRCPTTNNRLRNAGGGGVAQRSLHMEGQAIDVRLRGVALADLRDAALSLRTGGVGFYPRDQFVHLDIGRLRHW